MHEWSIASNQFQEPGVLGSQPGFAVESESLDLQIRDHIISSSNLLLRIEKNLGFKNEQAHV